MIGLSSFPCSPLAIPAGMLPPACLPQDTSPSRTLAPSHCLNLAAVQQPGRCASAGDLVTLFPSVILHGGEKWNCIKQFAEILKMMKKSHLYIVKSYDEGFVHKYLEEPYPLARQDRHATNFNSHPHTAVDRPAGKARHAIYLPELLKYFALQHICSLSTALIKLLSLLPTL